MALVRTNLSTTQLQSGTTTVVATSNAFTNGGLAVAVVGIQKEGASGVDPVTGSNVTVANSGTAYTWTKRGTRSSTGDYDMGIALFTAPISAGQTVNVTATFAGYTPYYKVIAVYQYTGQHASPIGVAGTKALANNGADSITLSGTPASSSEVIGGLVHACNGNYAISASPGTNHTETYDIVTNDVAGMQVQVQNIGTASATFAWADTESSAIGTANLTYGIAQEILAAAGGVDASANPVTATVTVTASNPTLTVSSSTATVAAQVTVTATNPTVDVPAPEVPGAPTDLAATPASNQVGLTWVAPVDDGGSAITDYLVQYRVTP